MITGIAAFLKLETLIQFLILVNCAKSNYFHSENPTTTSLDTTNLVTIRALKNAQ
jgi:hypothetical protein